jgi:hypothetical protein
MAGDAPRDEEPFGEEQVPNSPRERALELVVTVLLGLAALVSAWCAFQATRFSGDQSAATADATTLRIDSSRAQNRAGQLEIVDATAFGQYVAAAGQGNTRLADFIRARLRTEFRPAFEAWLARSPLTDPAAPATPFSLPEYQLASRVRGEALAAEAERRQAQGEEAGETGDRYVLAVVLLAAGLFLLGVQTRIGDFRLRAGLVAVAGALVLGTTVWILTLPISAG